MYSKPINPLDYSRIGVATSRGRPYLKFSTALKTLGIPFDPMLPHEVPEYDGHLVLTTRQEVPRCDKPVLYEDAAEEHPTVMRGLIIGKLSGTDSRELVIGIDPGQLIGLSAYYCGCEIEGSVYSSVDDLVSHIIGMLGGLWARRKILRVGNGNMKVAKQIATTLNLRFCSSFELEFVDEHGTSRKIRNFNQRGKRDVLSARHIARREGFKHHILPTSMTG